MKTIHTTIIQDHLNNRPINKLLNRPPPDIDKKEETLPHSTRRKLSQLRTNKSPLLMTYLHKIDPANHPQQTVHFATTQTMTRCIFLTAPTYQLH